MNRKLLLAGLAMVLAGAAGVAVALQPATLAAPAKPPAKRTILQQADVALGPAQETLVGTVEIPVGAGNPRHLHNGTEIGYVIEGHLRTEIEGQAPRMLGPGDSFLVPRAVPHQTILIGEKPAKLISTWTVDKGGELMIPVK
jgi:quercetin dioxygenase-like cupin family protein